MNKPEKPVRIAEGIYWVGALNPDMRRFDVIMETEFGTSYNSYVVVGADKIALIDAVRKGYLSESLALIKQVIDPSKIDYIVVQHTEPDHSGSIEDLIDLAPNAKILCTKPASLNLPFISHRELPITVVKDGDSIDLGGRTLKFISAPFLHWPDTMFTYDDKTGSLFTCDAFGCHFAPENVLESLTDEKFKGARRYYYDCIVAPFAPFVTKAIAHVNELGLNVSAILPSHGPVLDKDPAGAVELYAGWAKERERSGSKKVFIGYVTCYGYTQQLAQAFAEELNARGIATDMADLADITAEEADERIYRSDALAIGTPTVNSDSLPPIWQALGHLAVPLVRGRKAAVFGSYGWSGEAVPSVERRLNDLGFKVVGTYKTRFRPDEQALKDVRALAASLAESI